MAIDWTRGYSASYRLFEVNRSTWADAALVGGVTSATVSRDASGDSPLLESGAFELDREQGAMSAERYLRLAMSAEQDGERVRMDVCTLLCLSNGETTSAGVSRARLSGRSVLWPASRMRLTRGSYAPAGSNGAQLAASMLSSALDCPVSVDGEGFLVSDAIVFELGATVLEVVWLLLRAGGHTLRIDGRGRVSVRPLPGESALTLLDARARLVMPGVDVALDWSEVPNRYVAVEGDATAMATNDDPESVVSTAARGYVVDPAFGVDTSPVRVGGESLRAYCARRLAELSVVREYRTYTREWWPDVYPADVVSAAMPSEGLDGKMRVESQDLEIDCGLMVTERSYREVALWPV